MFNWLSLVYLLGAGITLWGVALSTGAKEFFSKSKELEELVVKKIDISTSGNLSENLPDLLDKLSQEGQKLFEKLKSKALETTQS